MDENKPSRRSFLYFSIRDLLWAMVVLGLVVGWWADRSALHAKYHADSRVLRMLKTMGFDAHAILDAKTGRAK